MGKAMKLEAPGLPPCDVLIGEWGQSVTVVGVGGRPLILEARTNGYFTTFSQRSTVIKHEKDGGGLRVRELSKKNLLVLTGAFATDLHVLIPTDVRNNDDEPFWQEVEKLPLLTPAILKPLFDAAWSLQQGSDHRSKVLALKGAIRDAMKIPGFSKELLLELHEQVIVEEVMSA